MATQILVVDDDDVARSAVQHQLEEAGYTVLVAAGSGEALRLARLQPPAVALINLALAGASGLELCRRLWAVDPALPIIPLLASHAPPTADVLIKPVRAEVLLARVRRRLRERAPTDGELLQIADLRLDTAAREAWRGERHIALTTMEFELLWRFLQHPRQVLSRDFLYERVWGHDFEGESKVLEVYVHYLRQKLEAGGEPRLLHTVRGSGYVLREASEHGGAVS
jgi:two-component system response regulator MprA